MLVPVNPPGTVWPGLSQGVTLKGSGLFVTSGHVGMDEKGELVTSSIEDQVVAMFESLRRTLAEAGLGFQHVARTTCFVREFTPELLTTIKSVRSRYYNSNCPPASVIVQAVLYDARILIEAEVIAVCP
jgi:2-iminobutanoate/2-iminopropanoate deaminase